MHFLASLLKRFQLVCAFGALAVCSAHAQLRTYQFAGAVTSVSDPTGYFDSAVTIGDVATVAFSWQRFVTHERDNGSAYAISLIPVAPMFTTFSAGAISTSSDFSWHVTGWDDRQAAGSDALRFYGFDHFGSDDYLTYWEVAVVGSSSFFDSEAFRADWQSVVNSGNYSNMYLRLSVTPKIWDGNSWSASAADVFATIEGSIVHHELKVLNPVPEPATYAGAAVAMLVGLVVTRPMLRNRVFRAGPKK